MRRPVFADLHCLALALVAAIAGCDESTARGNAAGAETASKTESVDQGDPGATTVADTTETGDAIGTESRSDSLGKTEPTGPAACSDDQDNDGDGLVDWQHDLGCYGPGDDTEGRLKTRELDNGWSVFEPSHDTRIIYVSSSAGKDSNRGTSPEKPKKTLAAAMASTRNNHADWVLLARGDTWNESITLKEGRSREEPFVVATYGESTERPLLKTGSNGGLIRSGNHYNNFAVVGIAFYAHTRDPKSPDFEDASGVSGFDFYSRKGSTGSGILLEDCWFNFYTGNVIQGHGVNKDIVVRRNLITNNYSTTAHSMGIYSKNASIVLEENVFDHNGWYKRQTGTRNDKTDGQATLFNHNTYFVDQKKTTFRRNIFLRPSSISNKWTANSGPGSTSDIVIDNNLYVDGEIGMSIGGNDPEAPYRFKNVTITNNVLLDMGRSRPTNRPLGWYIQIDDWDGGKVSKNLFLHQPRTTLDRVYAFYVDGVTRDVVIEDNVVHGLHTGLALVFLSDGANKQRVSFVNNQVQSQTHNAVLIEALGEPANYTFTGNTYYSGLSSKEWFKIGKKGLDLAAWKEATRATGSAQKVAFPDRSRSIETYQRALRKTATIDSFIAEVLAQSKYHWREQYTAAAVNDWIRAGFVR